MQIKHSKQLSKTEKQRLFGWGEDIFQSEPLDLLWRPKERHLVLYVADEPVSHCGLVKQNILVDGQTYSIGGIGGVVTPPHFQGRGYARALLREALLELNREGHASAMLFCHQGLVPFYQTQGWHNLQEPVTVLQSTGVITFPACTMVYPLKQIHWPSGPIHIDGLPW